MTFPRWRQSLARSLHVQRSKPESKFFQVANAYSANDANNIDNIVVENRTMVFRCFAQNSHTLLAISDSRADKFTQWLQSPSAQICWYFTKTREQFRINAKVQMLGHQGPLIASTGEEKSLDKQNKTDYCKANIAHNDQSLEELRTQMWTNLSEKAKSQFYWPRPKEPLHNNGKASDDELKSSIIPDNFIVICFQPYYVDYLNLTTDPQTREIHLLKQQEWTYQTVNP